MLAKIEMLFAWNKNNDIITVLISKAKIPEKQIEKTERNSSYEK